MNTTTVRGGQAEIAAIDKRVSAVGAGRGGVLLIEGPAGIGKSRLGAEVVHRAQRAGARVLRSEPVRGRRVPFGPLPAALWAPTRRSVTRRPCPWRN